MKLSFLLIFTTICGFSLMALEMISFRIMAPFFGTSTFIWSLIIATVMFFIFIGNLLGGKFSKKYENKMLFILLAVAAILNGVLSQSEILFLEYIYTTKLIYNMVFFGFLMLFSILILSLPILFISMASPWLIKMASVGKSVEDVGDVSGKLYALNTAGGLLGTFLPVLILVPYIGSRMSLLLVSFLLFLINFMFLMHLKEKKVALVLLIFMLLTSGLYFIEPPLEKNVLVKKESMHNTIWVKKNKRTLDLLVNEKKAIQSRLYLDDGVFREDVWTLYLSAAFLNQERSKTKVLFLGLGAGSSSYYYKKYFPSYELTGVEIDGDIVDLGKKYFKLSDKDVEIHVEDARLFLHKTQKKYDIVIVDTFKFPYIPSHLATLEFIQLVKKKLHKGGVALFNVGRYKKDMDIVDMLAQTGLKAFKHAYALHLGNTSNSFLYFMNHEKKTYFHKPKTSHFRLKMMANRFTRRLKEIQPNPKVIVSTDDRPLTEMLTNKIILKNLKQVF